MAVVCKCNGAVLTSISWNNTRYLVWSYVLRGTREGVGRQWYDTYTHMVNITLLTLVQVAL